jgi:hypothetical protein
MSKKKDKVEISKMVITVGGKEIEMTVDEAQQLKDKLNALFGTTENHHHYTTPIVERIIEKERRPYWYWSTPYCGTTTDGAEIGWNDTAKVSLLANDDTCLQTY